MPPDLSKLSDVELESIAKGNLNELSDTTLALLAGEPAQPKGSYLMEALRKGVASTPSTLAGILSGYAATQGPIQAAVQRGMGMPTAPQPPSVDALTAFQQGRAQVYNPLMQVLGSTGAEPTTGFERILAAGAQAVASPESYLFPPLAAVRRAGPLAQNLLVPAEQAAVGAGAEAGGQAGGYVGEKVGLPGVGQFTGSLFGGAGGAYGLGSALKLGPMATQGGGAVKSLIDKFRGTVPQDELLRDVDTRINNVFIAAAAADPNFSKVMQDALKAQKSVSLKAPGGVEVQMPINALLAENPVINTFVQQLSAKDPLFRAKYGAQYDAARKALVDNQILLFGDPSKVKVNVTPVNVAKAQARKIASIDDQIASLSRNQELDPTTFGERVAALVSKKEDQAMAEVRPLYAEAFTIAKDKNVELPAGSVDDIFNFVAGSQASDIFKTFPSIYNRVRAKFRPETVEPSAILSAEGKPITEGGVSFSAATVEDLDSLKREINKQLRRTTEPSDIRLLTELKQRVMGHVSNLDPDFVTAYRNADNAYLQKVGLPFNSETLKLVDRKKFVEQIAPALIGNKSNVLQFINATGEEGVRVARDAFIDSFTKTALKDDVIDPKAAAKWLDKNKGGVSMVPGLEDEIRNNIDNVQALINERTRMNAAFKKVAGDNLLKLEDKTAQELVDKMYKDPTFTQQFVAKYGADKDNLNAIRSFMLDDIVKSTDSVATLNDRNKAAAFNRVFGPTYAQKVMDFAEISNRLNKNVSDVSFRGETVPKTPVEELTGIPPEQIISRIYNPVSGATYAITSLFSKFWANKAAAATEERLKSLLLNPADAAKVFQSIQPKANMMDRAKIDEAIRIGKKYGINWINDAINDVKTGAMRGAVQQSQQQTEMVE